MKTSKRTFILFLIFLILAMPVMATTPWTSKPPLGSTINLSHPLSKGLVGCWLMNEGGGKIANNLAKKPNGIISSTTTWVNTEKGQSLSLTAGNSDNVDLGNKYSPESSPFSICIWAISNSSVNQLVISSRSASSTEGYEFLQGNGGTQGAWQLRGNDGATAILVPFTGSVSVPVDNKIHFFAGTMLPGSQYFYVDGVQKATNTVAYGTITNSQNLFIGKRGTTYATTKVSLVLYFNRILSPSEIRRLYYEPYCFIEYKPWTMWGAVVAAARRIWIAD